MLSTPNRLHKDARQKNSNTACAFICLGKEREGGRKGVERGRRGGVRGSGREKRKTVICGYGYLWSQEQREREGKKILKEKKGGKRGEKRGSISF